MDQDLTCCDYIMSAVKPLGAPEDYLEIDDPSLMDENMEILMDLSSPNPAL